MEEVSANKAAKYTYILAQQKGYVDFLFSAGCVLMHTYRHSESSAPQRGPSHFRFFYE